MASCGNSDPPPLNDESEFAAPAITARDNQAAIHASPSGYIIIDTLTGGDVKKRQPVELTGWAFAPDFSPCAGVGLVIDQRKVVSATYGIGRADVALVYRQYLLYWAGYRISEPASAIGPGTHTIYVVCKTRSGAMYRHPTTYPVKVN
jgi:hypothetical protein